jgi:hypothetical protein
LEFVRQHPNWSAFIVFGLSLGESLPLVSLVLPFWAMLVGIGTIIALADPLIFWTIVAAAAALRYPSSFLSLFKSWVLSWQRSGR